MIRAFFGAMAANFCARCGSAVLPEAKFCAKCGATLTPHDTLESPTPAIVAPPATPPTPVVPPLSPTPPVMPHRDADGSLGNRTIAAPRKASRSNWMIGIPIALIVIGLLVWALLAGLPFGSKEPKVAQREVDVVEETTTVTRTSEPTIIGETATVVELPSNTDTTVTSVPNVVTSTVPVTGTYSPAPSPVIREVPDSVRTPAIAAPVPAPRQAPPASTNRPPASTAGEISESEAVSVLDSYLMGSNPYDVDLRCLSVRSVSYRNAGYTLSVRDKCDGGVLGQWRLDSKTREIFRQRSDGRFLRP